MTKAYLDQSYPLWLVKVMNEIEKKPTESTATGKHWLSQPRSMDDRTWEVLTFQFKTPASIGEISMELFQIPSEFEVWYTNRAGVRSQLLDKARRPIAGSVSSTEVETDQWTKYSSIVYPIVAVSLQIKIRRVRSDFSTSQKSISLGLRNVLLKRNIYTRNDALLGFESDTDPLGNYISKTVKDWDPVKAADDNAYTFWQSEPQPSPDAVVSFFVDTRDADGNAQIIDRFYMDPLYSDQQMNVYYSTDDTVGTRRLSTSRVPALNEDIVRRNLVLDPRMTTSWDDRWFGGTGAGTYTPVSGSSPGGGVFLRKTWTVDSTTVQETGFHSKGLSPVEGGRVYTLSGHLRTSIAGRRGLAWVEFYDSNSVVIEPRAQGTVQDLTANVWNRLRATVTSPSNASFARLVLDLVDGGPNWVVGNTLDAAGALFEQSESLNEYFDGSYSRSQWDGPVNVSTSTMSLSTNMDAVWEAGRGLALRSQLSSSYALPSDKVGFDPSESFWVGQSWVPGFVQSSSPLSELVLLKEEGVGFTVSYLGTSKQISASYKNATGTNTVLTLPPLNFSKDEEIYWAFSVNREKQTVLLTARKDSGQVVSTSNNVMPRTGVSKYINFKNVGGYLSAFILKQESALPPQIAPWLQDPYFYLSPDPVIEDEDGRLPSTTTDNALIGVNWKIEELPFGGLDSAFFQQKVWSPIWRDWVVKKSFFFLPEAVSAKYMKFEFTNLTERPYPVWEAGIETKYQTFPVDVKSMAQEIAKTITTSTAVKTTVDTNVTVNTSRTGSNNTSSSSNSQSVSNSASSSSQTYVSNTVPNYEISIGTGTVGNIPNMFDQPLSTTITSEVSNENLFKGSTKSTSRAESSSTHTDVSYQTTYTTMATDAYYTVVSGDYLIAIAAKYGIAWQDIYYANQAPIDLDPRVKLLPARSAGWWIFPGQRLKIPGVVMQQVAQTTTIVEKKTTNVAVSTTVQTDTSTDQKTVVTTTRERFTNTSVHKYDTKIIKRDSSLAYFAGMREIQVFRTNWAAETDEEQYAILQYSSEDFTFDGTYKDDFDRVRRNAVVQDQVVPGGSGTPLVNLASNPSFEKDFSNVTAGSNTELSLNTSWFVSGGSSLQIKRTVESGTATAGIKFPITSDSSGRLIVVLHTTLNPSEFPSSLSVVTQTGSGVTAQTLVAEKVVVVGGNAARATFSTPQSPSEDEIYVKIQMTTSAGPVSIDQIFVGRGFDLSSGFNQFDSIYFDGDTPDTSTYEYVWLGVPGSSRSARRPLTTRTIPAGSITSEIFPSFSPFQRLEIDGIQRPIQEREFRGDLITVAGNSTTEVVEDIVFSGQRATLLQRDSTTKPIVKTPDFSLTGGSQITLRLRYLAKDMSYDSRLRVSVRRAGAEIYSREWSDLALGKWSDIETVPLDLGSNLSNISVHIELTGTGKFGIYLGSVMVKSTSIRYYVSNDGGLNYYDATAVVNRVNTGFVFPTLDNRLRYRVQLLDVNDYLFGAKLRPHYVPNV